VNAFLTGLSSSSFASAYVDRALDPPGRGNIWGTSADGQRFWSAFQSIDLYLVGANLELYRPATASTTC
jgi:hypothetical protein